MGLASGLGLNISLSALDGVVDRRVIDVGRSSERRFRLVSDVAN